MFFKLKYTLSADKQLSDLENSPSEKKRLKAVRKALGYMETNLKHKGLKTHKYSSLRGKNSEEVFEAYAQNKTPAAYRIFWHYGPGKGIITVIAITQHP